LIVRVFTIFPDAIDTSLRAWRPFKHAYLIRLDEKIVQEIEITKDGAIHLQVDGHKIITLSLSD
jgi:hypothetical protein